MKRKITLWCVGILLSSSICATLVAQTLPENPQNLVNNNRSDVVPTVSKNLQKNTSKEVKNNEKDTLKFNENQLCFVDIGYGDEVLTLKVDTIAYMHSKKSNLNVVFSVPELPSITITGSDSDIKSLHLKISNALKFCKSDFEDKVEKSLNNNKSVKEKIY